MEKIIIREQYLKKIRPFYESKYIKVITGVRRCGKSEILYQIINEIKDEAFKRFNDLKNLFRNSCISFPPPKQIFILFFYKI